MGPQLCSCGNHGHTGTTSRTHTRFNGAATLQLRKLDVFIRTCRDCMGASMGPQLCSCGNCPLSVIGLTQYTASMGPQLCSCGNRLPLATRECFYPRFNGGRNFAVAETKARTTDRRPHSLASMGPQLCSCGNCGLPSSSPTPPAASMGPQLCSCGNGERHVLGGREHTGFNGAATLQLRKPSVVEYP